jgi:hypothetical protein
LKWNNTFVQKMNIGLLPASPSSTAAKTSAAETTKSSSAKTTAAGREVTE